MPDESEVIRIIESRLATIPAGNNVEVGFFGGNFTGIELETQKRYLSLIQNYIKAGAIQSIRLSTRPDYVSQKGLEILKKYNVGTIELGAQSLSDEVLKKSGRGHSANDVRHAAALIREHDFKLGLQMMIGLPGDTAEMSMETAREFIRLGTTDTRIYPTLVIRDTLLSQRWQNGLYIPLTLEEAISLSAKIVRIFEDNKVTIIRLGLHPSEGLLSGEDLLAGPFHPAFGELVYSRIWQDDFLNSLNHSDAVSAETKRTVRRLIIEVAPGQLNAAVGHGSINKNLLLQHFREVKFRENDVLSGRQFIYNLL
jgi:histone acetyltransferase (RNA polymerase elongator complex component)